MNDHVLAPPDHTVPVAFTRAQLEWLPWLEPLAVEALTERHVASLVDAARVKSPYFRLLARDPDALEARTRTDKDIFYNPDAGLPRAEAGPAGAARGSSISGLASSKAIAPTRTSWRCLRTRPSPTCSTAIHPFRSTATSAALPASSKCSCNRMRGNSPFFPRCRPRGRQDR